MERPQEKPQLPAEDGAERLRRNLRRIEVMYGLMLKQIWEVGRDLNGSPERERLGEILRGWLRGAEGNLAMIVDEETGFDEPWVRCDHCDTLQPFSECFDGYVEDADRFSCKACDHSWVIRRATPT